MTNREVLEESLYPVNILPDDVPGELPILPLTFSDFITGMTAVVIAAASAYLKHDFPELKSKDNRFTGGGKAVDGEPTIKQVLDVLLGKDFLRGVQLSGQLRSFLEWWLDQETKEMFSGGDDDTTYWADVSCLNDEWNRYVGGNT